MSGGDEVAADDRLDPTIALYADWLRTDYDVTMAIDGPRRTTGTTPIFGGVDPWRERGHRQRGIRPQGSMRATATR
jgi:hypothetical protein